jgi:hypothetical protein
MYETVLTTAEDIRSFDHPNHKHANYLVTNCKVKSTIKPKWNCQLRGCIQICLRQWTVQSIRITNSNLLNPQSKILKLQTLKPFINNSGLCEICV